MDNQITELDIDMAFRIIKEHKLLNYVLKNDKCAEMYHLNLFEKHLLKKVFYEKEN